jgi:uncharacterized damage-inducible protein DinB
MDKSMVTQLFDYNAWAFEKVWECIGQLTDEQFCLDTGFSQGSIRSQMVHVINATRRWLDRLQELPARPHLESNSFQGNDDLKKEWGLFLQEMRDYIDSLDEASLLETVRWEIPSRQLSAETTRREILLHLANHATDHRAQILAAIDLYFHKETAEQDLIFYLIETQP